MRTAVGRMASLTFLLSAAGCGPLHMPMPVRLDVDEQRQVDDAWNRALYGATQPTRQQLLDALISGQAYQLGVDRLMMRSEKHVEFGLVVMEIHADRAAPSEDSFAFSLYDRQGGLQRQERYTRDDVENTYKELFVELAKLEQIMDHDGLSEVDQRRFDELQMRANGAASLMPHIDAHRQPADG